MASSNACWGLELGAGSVKALRLELRDDAPVVTDLLIVPHPKVLSTPGLDQDDAMRVALGALASQKDLSGARVAVGVPGHASFARFAKLPPVEPKKIPDIVKFEAAQQIPFPLTDVEWDYQTFQSPGSPDVEVGIFAMTKDRMKRQLDQLADVGISPEIITLNQVAAYNAMAFDLEFTEKTAGTIILDIGTVSTDLIIAEAGRVWVRTFNMGGHAFTEAVAQAFNLSYPKADRLKREAQQTKHAKHVFQAMRDVFSDLAQEVQRSIGYYQNLHRDAKLERLIGLGATFNLPGLRKFLKQQISMDVYRLEQFKRAGVGEGVSKEQIEGSAGELAVCYGLALQGLGLETIQANLIPVEIVRETMWRRKTPLFIGAAALALVGSGMMFWKPMQDRSTLGGLQAPREIADATRAVNEAKSAATEAGVLGGARADMSAANMVELTARPEVHARILADVGEMFNDATARLREMTFGPGVGVVEPPAFELVKLSTQYVPPETAISGVLPSQRTIEDDPNEDRQRIAVTMVAKTPHPDPRQFVVDTLDKWLKTNAKRANVGYFIVAESEDLLVRIDSARLVQVTQDTRSGARRGGASRRQVDDFVDPAADFDMDAFLAAGGMVTGTAPARGRRDQAGSRELDTLAPIKAPADPREATLKEVEIFWYVVLGEAPKADGSGEEGGN